MDSLLGNYYTVISIIIVYHLFSIQQWLDRVTQLESEAEEVRRTTAVNDIGRERLKARLSNMSKKFPWFQISLLLFALTAILYLSILVAYKLPQIPSIYSIGPTVILWLVFVAATGGTWRQGKEIIKKTTDRL